MVEERYPEIVAEYRARLEKKMNEILTDVKVEETRIIAEAAIYAERTDIGEETVRLASHIKEFRNAIKTDQPIGKKLDFMVQEMNREINTIGSKCGNSGIAHLVVEAKTEMEKVREQIQNIE